jgi:acyl transferase domain-containing protein/NADPH:quinone reductase-like Zn-dependent oxidoreductase
MKWPSEGVRRVSINSFGFGGTNAHVVIDDAFHYLKEHSLTGNTCSTSKLPGDNDSLPSSDDTSWVKPTITASGCRLLVFSAADEKGLCRTRDDILRYYRQKVLEGFATLDDFAFTLSARRSNLNWRCHAVVDPETSHLKTDVMVSTPYRSSQQHGAAFIFTGQGAEHHQMGLELLLYPVFRDALDEIDSILSSFGCKWSIVDELQKSENISQAEYSQPICTGIQIALIKLLASLNICPVAVLGHSSGEIAAAYCVGALSMESACKVAYYRGLLAGKMKAETSVKGAMMSVNLPADGFQEYIDQTFDPRPDPFNLSVACINSPKNITVSGDDEAIDVLKEALDRDKIFAMKLSTGIAYHTPAMAAIAGEYERAVGELKPQYQGKNRVPLFSTVTGTQVPASMMSSAGYWVRNLLSPVLFNSAMSALLGSNNKAQLGMPQSRTIYDLIEVGPSAALQRPCRDILEVHFRGSEVRYASVLERKRSSMKTSLSLVGALHDYGYPVSITSANRQSVTPAASPNCLADLPQYPFDRTQHYWHESRISRDYRLRAHVPKTVLGAQTLDYTPLQPRWRKIINTKETPWVADHVVSGSCIFPGTGMLIMALEAARQGAIGTKPLRGFQIKDAVFLNPVVLRENSEGESEVEVICHLRPLLNPNERDASRSEVCISTCHRTLWTECFRCTVQLLYDDALNEVDGGAESKLAAESARTLYNSAVEKCATPLPSTSFYAYCAERGITYGSSFSILQNIRWNKDGTATGVVDVSQPSSSYEGLVHPAIVDAACQVCWLAPSRGLTESMPTEVPRRLQDMYVAAVGWKSPETSRVRICSSASFKEAGRGIAGTITILADDGSLLCKVGRLELAPVADDIQSESYTRKLLHGIDWQPCLSMLSPLQLAETCKAPSAPAQAPSTEGDYQKLIQALKLISRRALADLDDVEIQLAKPHIQRYIAWLRTLEETSSANSDNSTTSLEQKLGEIERARPQWEVHTAVARNLLQILRGEVDPLSIIFSTDLAERYYQDIFERSCDSRFQRFLDLFTFEHPELKILEVGAGTGSMTHHVLTALQDRERESGGTRFSRYTYTDISHAFFEDAREKFKGFHDRMDFRILDLEKDVAAQGYGEVEYDLIIAGAVLHTTQNLHATLRNVRKCLKPGGKILFFENVVPDVALQFSFGTLSGWWRGVESWRNGAQHQCTSESQWDDLLLQSGFSGNDLLLEGPDEHTRTFSIIVSTAIGDYPDRATKRSVLLCMDSNSKTQGEFANGIIKSARFQENCVFKILGIDELSQVEIDNDDQVVMLHEIDGSLLQCLTTQQLQALQLLMRTARNILWITKTVIGDQDNAFVGMTTGFLRTMRSEATNSRIVRLNLEQAGPQSLDGIDETVAVLERCFQRSAPEVEYFLRNGRIMLGRLCEASALNEAMLDAIYPKLHSAAWQEGPDVMLDVGTPGNLDTLRFIPDPIPREQLGPHDVEIDARAWGLNFRDVFIALGRMDEKEFGLDTAGYVRRVGSKCVTLKVGDRVVMARCGSLRKYPRAEERVVIKIPGWLSFDDAASLPAPAMTAYHCLVDVAHLQPGERVLIHSAAGATGQLAVQLALKIGAEIFATVSSAEKKQMLHRTYGIPADHIFYSRKSSFAECVLRMTKGQGVDVILNSLAGDGLRGSWECIGPFGRFIEIGKADIQAGSMLPMGKFEQNVSYSAVDVRQILVVRKEVAHGLLKTAIELLEAGHVRCPHPRHVYPVSKIEHAFRFLQSGKNFGRIVINNAPDDIVPKLLTTQSTWTFSADASYLIAGGLGGIGRAISRWMVEKGARHLILPSRSGPRAPVALELIQELEERGVSIMAPVCDVGSAQSLEDLLTRCQGSIPAIRGCINAAMDLQVGCPNFITTEAHQTDLPLGLDF